MENNEIPVLTLLLDEKERDDRVIIDLLADEELLLAFNGNHLIELNTDNNRIYLPLFTDENQIPSDFNYTRLDKVKLKVVLDDIFISNRYYAITLNPYTHDYILNYELIKFIEKRLK